MMIDEVLSLMTSLTGLTFDDLMRQAEAKTEDEKAEALAENVAKMAEHRKLRETPRP